MDLFAHINALGVVQNVVVGTATIPTGCTELQTWMDSTDPEAPANPRKNYATIGGTYDAVLDAFIYQQPYPSWVLDANAKWQAPVPMPDDGKMYRWDESTLSWVATGFPT